MANINYTATADLKSFSTWCTNNVDQNASTWDSGTGEGVLVLNSGVTQIGQGAFQNCTTITKVTIGEGITSIGNNAFNGLQNLTFAELPSTLTALGNTAFWNNSKLEVVYCKALTPPTLTGSNFSNTNGLLFVPSSVISDYNNSNWVARFSVIYPYNGNGVITYHSSVDLSNYSTWITQNAISTTYDSTTQTGTIEVFPYEIGNNAFYNCSTLTELSFTNIIKLGNYCFYNSGLTIFTIPDSIINIDYDAFKNTTWWNSQSDGIIYKDNWCLGYKGSRPTGELNISNGTKRIINRAFSTCTDLTKVTLPDSLIELSEYAFSNCSNISTIVFGESLTIIRANAFNTCRSLVEITFLNSLTTIANQAFYGCSNLTTITFPESLMTIESSAFSNCTSLTTIYWNAINVNTYGGYTNIFGSSTPIDTVIFGNSVTTIPNNVFLSCATLTQVTLSNSVTNIPSSAFRGCTSLTEITFPDSLTTIATQAFLGCSNLTNITFPDSVTTIGQGAFQSCTGLTEITLPESLTNIGQGAFSDCTSLTTIYWNAINITSYLGYNNTFGSSTPIDTIIFGNSVTTIPSGAFNGCTRLTEITLPESLTRISGNAFRDCTGLTEIMIPDSVTIIGEGAFNGCTSLTEITLPKSLTNIGTNTFNNCTSLTTIYWNAINVNTYGGYTNIFGSSTPIDTVIFGNSVTTIPYLAFSGCTGLTEVTFPESFTSIGGSAFSTCPNLLSVTSLNTIPPILGQANFTVSDDTLYMPIASKSAYQSANQWSISFTYYKGLCEISTSTDGNGTITPTELVPEGESFTVTATPNEHYKVSHFVVDGVDVGTIDNYTFQNLDADHIIHVDFELITHTITATAFEGGAIVPSGAITVNEGENQSFDIVPLEGYGILALFIDGAQIEPVETYTFTDVEADHTIQAMFYTLQTAGFNRDEMLDLDYIIQDYLEQLKKRD